MKSVISKCQLCRVKKAIPLAQKMAPLPPERTSMAPPFTFVGVDHSGPYVIQDGEVAEKGYVALYTCLSTRMCHLELQKGLTTSSFIDATRRMIARRGWPQKIFSDSHLTFKRAAKDLKARFNDLDWQKVMRSLTPSFQPLEWYFSAPHAPWWGGVYERMVGLMKQRMLTSFRSARLTYEGFATVLTEVEACLNSRPLGVLRLDPHEPVPITPANLGIGRHLLTVPDASVQNIEDRDLLKRLRHQQALTRSLWRDFSRDYLQELTRRKKWNQTADLPSLEGQVVIVRDDKVGKKNVWPLMRVVKAIPGRDGRVRSCELRSSDGKIIRRPVQKIALIENYEMPKVAGAEPVQD